MLLEITYSTRTLSTPESESKFEYVQGLLLGYIVFMFLLKISLFCFVFAICLLWPPAVRLAVTPIRPLHSSGGGKKEVGVKTIFDLKFTLKVYKVISGFFLLIKI